ncbi:hypothetical protein EV182_006583 [Spiromyces aspiralis]|uniref:Uncharacterized protein n=1 Tax=Spiromyces aspiralis TaxID=68401 RepID=A0ACC1HBN1_9FUNG|nr:hypothetical protein EV182_006583 [Spiromyces aspiralis]
MPTGANGIPTGPIAVEHQQYPSVPYPGAPAAAYPATPTNAAAAAAYPQNYSYEAYAAWYAHYYGAAGYNPYAGYPGYTDPSAYHAAYGGGEAIQAQPAAGQAPPETTAAQYSAVPPPATSQGDDSGSKQAGSGAKMFSVADQPAANPDPLSMVLSHSPSEGNPNSNSIS